MRKLGGRGFGVVYLARDTMSGVEVALKTLHPLLKTNAEEMERLREKFALVSRLSHPNIASALVKALAKNPQERFKSCAEFVESCLAQSPRSSQRGGGAANPESRLPQRTPNPESRSEPRLLNPGSRRVVSRLAQV